MKPTVVSLEGYDAYAMTQVETILGPERYAAFTAWLVGQTLATLDDGRVVCFKRDYERFMARQRVSD